MLEEIKEYEPDVMLSDVHESHIKVGQNLLTRHGRIGNAIIIGIDKGKGFQGTDLYAVLTDFGNIVTLSWLEIERAYNLEETCYMVQCVESRIKTQIQLLTNALVKVREVERSG